MNNEMIEPNEPKTRTIKVDCHFTGYVTVYLKNYKDKEEEIEDIENQLNEMSFSELTEETDKVEIDAWEEI